MLTLLSFILLHKKITIDEYTLIHVAQNITFILHDHYMYNNLLIWKCFIETRSINLFIHWLKSVSHDW